MIVFTGVVIGFALLRFIIALVNFLGNLYLPRDQAVEPAKVSILIPARNEEHNLPRLLDELLRQSWKETEILVYDDESDDETATVTEMYAQSKQGIRLIKGKALPRGWVGKNHACHRLAEAATGDYLLFLDADVIAGPDLVSRALACMQKQGISLLSVFPRQVMYTRGERITVPLMNWILLSLLPLKLVRQSLRPSLAAANGQFMMFTASSYEKEKWHEQVRGHAVDDILISRMMKKKGYKIATLLGDHDISCRMYDSYGQAVRGFSRNVAEYFGGSLFLLLAFTVIMLAGPLAVVFSAGPLLCILYFLLITMVRFLTSAASKQEPIINILNHPSQMAAFLDIVITAVKMKTRKKTEWKGREIKEAV